MRNSHRSNLGIDSQFHENSTSLEIKLPKFPTTRFQGSKRKVLPELAKAFSEIEFENVLDMYCGSGIVTLLFRFLGKEVTSNDFMLYNQNTSRVFQASNSLLIENLDIERDLNNLLHSSEIYSEKLVSNIFNGIYFTDDENIEIDRFCQNIGNYQGFAKSLYIYAVGQALIKKRPYNLFHRANLNMRMKDVKRSFGNKKTWETPIIDHALKCISELQKFPIVGSQKERVLGLNSSNLHSFTDSYDLIYLDPPYMNSKGRAIDYSDFYHFLDGLCDYDLFSEADTSYDHKPIKRKFSAWYKPKTALEELSLICEKWDKATVVLSYRSDGLPKPHEVSQVMSVDNRVVKIFSAGDYKYALSRTHTNEELIIISSPVRN